MLNSQGQWRPSCKCQQYVAYQKKMLLMVCLHYTTLLTLLTDTAQQCHSHVLICPPRVIPKSQNV